MNNNEMKRILDTAIISYNYRTYDKELCVAKNRVIYEETNTYNWSI